MTDPIDYNALVIFRKFKDSLGGLRLHLVLIMAALLTSLEGIGFTLFYPLMNKAVDPNKINISHEDNSLANYFDDFSLNLILIIIALIFLIKGTIQFFLDYQINKNKALISDIIRRKIINKAEKVGNFDYRLIDPHKYTNLINEQVNQVAISFQYFCQFFGHLIAIIIYSFFAITLSTSAFIFSIVMGIFIFKIFQRLNSSVKKLSKENAGESLNLTSKSIVTFNSFQYLLATKSFGTARQQLINISKNVYKINLKLGKAMAFTKSIREPFAVLVVVSIIYITTHYFGTAFLSIIISMLFIYKISTSVFGVQGNWQNTIGHIGALDRINLFLEEVIIENNYKYFSFTNNIKDQIGNNALQIEYILPKNKNKITVSLSYFKFSPGKINLISGRSGSGKSISR